MTPLDYAACLQYRRAVIERDFARMNAMQRQAVFCVEGPLLVLAGAGSGKTTVLVNRIANILRYGDAWASDQFTYEPNEDDMANLKAAAGGDEGALARVRNLLPYLPPHPWNVLAITFTNKAAGEMKERLRAMLGADGDGIWAGTFHSICAKILRRHDGGLPGFDAHFAIYDTDDSKRVMKEVQRQLRMDEKYLPHKYILNAVSKAKDRLIDPEDYIKEFGNEHKQRQIAEAYALYQKLLRRANAMDFDDIIFYTVRLLEQKKEVREQYQRRFKYILVDEYQDTNHAQYRLISLLAAMHMNLCVVGDDDQSIYRFRGATIENILQFEHQFSNAKVVRLEQNYRSTQNILDAANRVISNNESRKGKTLWTGNGAGEEIIWQVYEEERDEARAIADRIQRSVAKGAAWGDHAVLYRANALSSTIETQLVRAGVPYRIIGGHRFYDRKEIRDACAYLTVIANPADEIRLRRVVNEPKRGIGEATVQAAANLAAREGLSLYDVFCRADQFPELSRASAKIKGFIAMMEGLRAVQHEIPLKDLLELTLQRSGYMAALAEDKETFEDRKENLQELASNLVRYQEEAEEPSLWGFLEDVALQSDIDQYNAQADAAVLMTLHSAKGLEFPCVFLPAWEERVFPSYQTVQAGGQEDLEEERRLAYVGITRAKQKLIFTTARTRLLYGSTQYNPPSRFLKEAGIEENSEFGIRNPVLRTPSFGRVGYAEPRSAATPPREGNYQAAEKKKFPLRGGAPAGRGGNGFLPAAGDTVKHPTFGLGLVLGAKPMGNDTLLEIAFEDAGTKKLMANFAKLEQIC
ncbi:MAG: UvrD-helicase domain-containing protein [Firmicutes bacterium]|nr:UvrD-helicase domain-containing protein [Bacillota bacterium]